MESILKDLRLQDTPDKYRCPSVPTIKERLFKHQILSFSCCSPHLLPSSGASGDTEDAWLSSPLPGSCSRSPFLPPKPPQFPVLKQSEVLEGLPSRPWKKCQQEARRTDSSTGQGAERGDFSEILCYSNDDDKISLNENCAPCSQQHYLQ